MFYAQLDENDICIGVSHLSGEVQADNMIEIENYDSSLLGKKYDSGEWIEILKEEPEPQPTEQELLNAEFLLNQTEQSAKLKEMDEALALILLNQEGGIQNVL